MKLGLFRKRKREDDKSTVNTTSASAAAVAAAASAEDAQRRTVYHYPSSLPFPVKMDDDFPSETYRSRNTDVKSCVHWGQRKLLLSEIQLLCLYCRPEVSYHIVYAGSAPGTHLGFLDDMFKCRHTWELVDPGQFDRAVLEPRGNFTLRNEFFTNATAYGINARRLREKLPALGAVYEFVAVEEPKAETLEIHQRLQGIVGTLDVARGTEDIPSMYEPPLKLPAGLDLLCKVGMERSKPVLFVSDIRSGSVALPNFEEHVAENMRAQECWTSIIDASHSMLKFRLPYTHKAASFGGKDRVASALIRPDGTVPYLRGDMLLPIWTRPTSTEGRLVVPQGAFQKDYRVDHVEGQFFFFNARVREQVHFNHSVPMDENLGHTFDAAAEVNCLTTYLLFLNPELRSSPARLAQEVRKVSASITAHLGITFEDAIRRRDAVMLSYARAGVNEDDGDDDDGDRNAPGKSHSKGDGVAGEQAPPGQRPKADGNAEWEATMREMIRKAAAERLRGVWKCNVDESVFAEPSGFWVTTRMKQ